MSVVWAEREWRGEVATELAEELECIIEDSPAGRSRVFTLMLALSVLGRNGPPRVQSDSDRFDDYVVVVVVSIKSSNN